MENILWILEYKPYRVVDWGKKVKEKSMPLGSNMGTQVKNLEHMGGN